ncbi:MAG: rhomboid family intramembrane serine protease [Lentisphaerae bacterium]|jgi:membrane associated rhomboid family serine protease|nr:rhomboid family intramembrane serine protease [Lentisphaerota bacterium]
MKIATRIRNYLVKSFADTPGSVLSVGFICLTAFVMQKVLAAAPVRTILLGSDANYLLIPDVFTFLFAIHGLGLSYGFFWTPITYMFLHGSTVHLFLNMAGLYVFGNGLLRYTTRRTFWLIYIISGIVGGTGWALFNGLHSPAPCIGASAGVLGLSGAYAALRPDDKFVIFLPFPVVLKAWLLAVVLLLLNAFEFLFIQSQTAYLTHLIGIISGFFLGLMCKNINKKAVTG